MDAINLRMLIELAAAARDAAAARRAQAGAALDGARQQLKQLEGYAAEYERRGQRTLAVGTDIAAQDNLRAFAVKLQQAIAQQRGEIERRALVLEQVAGELAQAQRKLQSLRALQDRAFDAARQRQGRLEQKLLDELSQAMLAGRERPLAASGW
jgi:flagellar FliJ protein